MKQLIVHVGAHRSGSTAIQVLLTRRREELLAQGIVPLTRTELQADRLLAQLLALERRPIAAALASSVALARLAGRSVVVSEENLLGAMPMVTGPALYPRFGAALHGLSLLGRLFDLSVRWVVRRQDHFLESVYAFRVSRGAVDEFATYARELAPRLSWLPVARALDASTTYGARIGVYESLFAQGAEDVLADFLDLPRSQASEGKLRVANKGLRGPMLNVMRLLNLRFPDLPLAQRKASVRALEPFAACGDVLPSVPELAGALERAGFDAATELAVSALAFAATAPRPGLDRTARQELLARYASENGALWKLSCVRGDRSAWDG